jgi:DNA-directed RNA polymerase specialized sigma24 family protein
MDLETERHPYASRATELDADERYFATAPIDGIRRELQQSGVRVEPTIAMLQGLIEKQTAPLDPESTYLQNLESIERIALFVARRAHASDDEIEEFVQIARVKLFEDDYAIIRKFEGRSSFSTYLTMVILRLFHQWRIEKWGRWRPGERENKELRQGLERAGIDAATLSDPIDLTLQSLPEETQTPTATGPSAADRTSAGSTFGRR